MTNTGNAPTIIRYERTSTGWSALLSSGMRVDLRSSDGTGKVGSRKGGWRARRAGIVAHGDTREGAVYAWWFAWNAHRLRVVDTFARSTR